MNDTKTRAFLAGVSAARAQELRLPSLLMRRQLKMSRDAHAYVRGSTELFYRWLSDNHGIVPQGPRIWICGDAHVGNLGPIAAVDARVEVEVRDLDQTTYGNPANDLIRLGLSLAMGTQLRSPRCGDNVSFLLSPTRSPLSPAPAISGSRYRDIRVHVVENVDRSR